jgi:hypothetical protein
MVREILLLRYRLYQAASIDEGVDEAPERPAEDPWLA